MATTKSVYWMKLMLCCIIFIHQIIRNMQIFHHSSCYLVNVTDDSNFKGHLFSIFFLYPLKGTDQNRTTIGKEKRQCWQKGKNTVDIPFIRRQWKLYTQHTHIFSLLFILNSPNLFGLLTIQSNSSQRWWHRFVMSFTLPFFNYIHQPSSFFHPSV